MAFGLMSFGAALGDPADIADVLADYADDDERILHYGYRQVLRSAPGAGITDLALAAGKAALADAGVAAAEVDLVVLAITDIAEYLYWDAAASVAHRLGADRAEAVLLAQACTGGVISFDTVAGRFATHPGYSKALVIAANRTCETYWNRLDTQPMVFSDGAAAALAVRDHDSLCWLATEVITDGRYADLYRLDTGGAAMPFGSENAKSEPPRARDAWDVMEFFDYDADKFAKFAAFLDERTGDVTAAACARAGCTVADLSKVIMLADNRQAMTSIADLLAVPIERTNLATAMEYGHLGAADQLFCLGRYHAAGDLIAGSLVGLVSRGRGMHWACTVLRV